MCSWSTQKAFRHAPPITSQMFLLLFLQVFDWLFWHSFNYFFVINLLNPQSKIDYSKEKKQCTIFDYLLNSQNLCA